MREPGRSSKKGAQYKTEEMQIKIFSVPIVGGEQENEMLNKFLATHRVIDVQQVPVADRFWSFCVRYVNSPGTESASAQSSAKKDYKKILSEASFSRFSRLREARKRIANSDAIPAYVVFSDAELAQISEMETPTLAGMRAIDGVGIGRIETYGARILEHYNESMGNETLQSSF